MATEALDTALDRIEHALARLETAVETRGSIGPVSGPVIDSAAEAELSDLRTRHRKLKDKVAQELRQLDLLLANLPQ